MRWARQRASEEQAAVEAARRSERARKAAWARWDKARARGEIPQLTRKQKAERAALRALDRARQGLPPRLTKPRTESLPPDYQHGLRRLIQSSLEGTGPYGGKGARRKGPRRIVAIVEVLKNPGTPQEVRIQVPILVGTGPRSKARKVSMRRVMQRWESYRSAGGKTSYSKVARVLGVYAI